MVGSRRSLIAAAPALVLAACAEREPPPEPPPAGSDTATRGDRELLEGFLKLKARAGGEYEVAGRHAPPGFGEVENAHADRIAREVSDRGGRGEEGSTTYADHGSRRAALERLVDVEDTCIAYLVDALPKLSDPSLRALAAQILAVEAEQLSVLRGELGQSRAPDAFVAGRKAL